MGFLAAGIILLMYFISHGIVAIESCPPKITKQVHGRPPRSRPEKHERFLPFHDADKMEFAKNYHEERRDMEEARLEVEQICAEARGEIINEEDWILSIREGDLDKDTK